MVSKVWVVYILRCRDGSLYTGMTGWLKHRLNKHRDGTGSRYVRSRLPFTLVYVEQVESRSAALKREYAIKQLSKAQKEELIRDKP